MGGLAGSHAEYVRVPLPDHGRSVVPDALDDLAAVVVADGYTAHPIPLEDARRATGCFEDEEDGCVRPVFLPGR